MIRRHLLLLSGLLVCAAAAPRSRPAAEKPLRVVTTIPDLADLVRVIGGDEVKVESIARGTENLHAVRVRPSLILRTNRADLFVQMGFSLEHSWVPGLLETARNRGVLPGTLGFVNCSDGWEPIEVPETFDRAQGPDVHPMGNPHFNLSPRGGEHLARLILAKLIETRPASEAAFQERFDRWFEKLQVAQSRWEAIGRRLKGVKVVGYHREFSYFLREYGMIEVTRLEPKPGIPPTPRHLAQVIRTMREQDIRIIITAPWSKNSRVREVAKKTGATVVELPSMVGGVKGADDWISMMDVFHTRLAAALPTE